MAKSRLSPILQTIHGRLLDVEFRQTRDGLIAATPAPPRQHPPSPQAKTTNDLLAKPSRAWQTLTDTQRDQWETWARATQTRGNAPGILAYIRAARIRLALGLDLPTTPPTLITITETIQLTLAPDWPDPTTPRLIIQHNLTTTRGWWLRIEQTPPTLTEGRRPSPRDLRAIRGLGPDSHVPLAPTNTTYEFPGSRFSIPVGRRFALAATLLHEQGILAKPTFLPTRRS